MVSTGVKKCFNFCAAGLLWIPHTVFVLTPLLFLLIFRLFVHASAWLFRPELIPIYNPIEYVITTAPSNQKSQMNVSASLVLNGTLNIQAFRKHFEKTFLSSEKLRKRYSNLYCHYVQYGFFMFKKAAKDINLFERIKETTITVESFGEVETFMGKYVELQDYGENPNWEVLLVHIKFPEQTGNNPGTHENLVHERKSKTVLVLKFHHGLCDGYSLIHVIDTLCGNKSPYLVKDSKSTLLDKIWMLYNMPLSLLKFTLELQKCGKMPWPKFQQSNVEEMHTSFCQLELKKLKQVRKLAGCHFCTLLGVIEAEASRRFFISKGLGHKIPEFICVGTPLGRPNHPVIIGGKMQNHLTITTFRVNMRGDDLVSKVKEAEKIYCKIVEELMALEIGYRFCQPLTWPIPRAILNRIFALMESNVISSKFEHGITPNLLSSEKYNLLGVPFQSIYPHVRVSSFLKSLRLQIMTFSAGEYVNITVGGRCDSYGNREEVDYIAKVLFQEVLDDILKAFESVEVMKDESTLGDSELA